MPGFFVDLRLQRKNVLRLARCFEEARTSRIELTLPERFSFSTELIVRVSDVNFAGHLGHDSLVTLLHEARARLFRTLGGHELDLFGVGIILADLSVIYRSEAFVGDRLTVEIAARDFSAKGCELVYRVSTASPSPVEVARARTGMVFFDYGLRTPVPVPREFLARFGADALALKPAGASQSD